MRFDMRGVDHLRVCGSPIPGKLPEQIFPDAAPSPTHKTIINGHVRAILGRAITPAAAAPENLHDPADDAAIIRPLNAPYIGRQVRFDPIPLFVA